MLGDGRWEMGDVRERETRNPERGTPKINSYICKFYISNYYFCLKFSEH